MTPLLSVRDLTVRFHRDDGGVVHAVNGVSYDLHAGEVLGIVGESGSGKSVHTLAMLGLLPTPPARVEAGQVLFEGQDLLAMDEAGLRDIRGRRISFIFQDPMTALNPVLSIGRQIAEPLRRHMGLSHAAATRRAAELLDLVGIDEPHRRLRQFPHQFSGGMRQRAMIAIGIACEPKLLIADEATTALDVTVQAQVIELIGALRKQMGMTVIWITHDMGVVAAIADRVQVMYAGRIMECGPTEAVFARPHSAYSWSLLRSLPPAGPAQGRLFQIGGQPPDLAHPPAGDPFAPRNPFATSRCFRDVPPLRPVAPDRPEHQVAAWYDLPALLAARGGEMA